MIDVAPHPPRLPDSFSAAEAVEAFQDAYQWFFDSLIQDRVGAPIERTDEERQVRKLERINRIKSFLDYCGNPEQKFPAIHVAGTSGKGSVTMMITDLLKEAGYKTAHHTSPFLQSPTEKLVYDGRWEKPSYCVDLFHDFDRLHRGWQAAQDVYPQVKYGEAWVWLTFWWMAKRQVEWGIVETGLGGRFDPTVWVTPQVSVITNIAFDHVRSLGPTLPDIAWHKAGIIKPNTPAVIGVTEPELVEVFVREAAEKGAPLYRLGHEFDFEVTAVDRLTVRTPNRTYDDVQIGAVGHYQLVNAALAITAVDVALERPIPESSFAAFAQMTYPGRMEMMPDEKLVLLDGAHNPHKMAAAVRSLRQRYPDKKVVGLVGGLATKDLSQMLAHLIPHCRHMVVSQPKLIGKSVNPPEAVAQMIRDLDETMPITVEPDLRQAIDVARGLATADEVVFVTGSIYLIGQARDTWYPLEDLLLASEAGEI